jgi:hypothetical protein
MNQIDLRNYLSKEPERFELLYKELHCLGLDKETQYLRFFVDEMDIFHSLSGTIYEYLKNNETTIDTDSFKHFIYPVIRRLLEKCFTILYIFEDKSKCVQRYESYLKYIEGEYNKMYADLEKYDYPVQGLPKDLHAHDSASIFMQNINDRLTQLKNDNFDSKGNQYRLNYLYGAYRVLSFYAHGNISLAIMHDISPDNNNFSVIKPENILQLLASTYNYLICEIWPDICDKYGFELQ